MIYLNIELEKTGKIGQPGHWEELKENVKGV